MGAVRQALLPVSWRRPLGPAEGTGTPRGGSPPDPAWETNRRSRAAHGAQSGEAVFPGRYRPTLPRPPLSLAPPPRRGPAPSRLSPPSRARAGGVAFKSSPVFWGPRAGRADLVRMSRAVTPAPGSMCAAEGRIIWPAARAGGRTGGASAAGRGGPTGGVSARGPAPPASRPPGPAGDPGPTAPRTRALP